ARAPELLGDPAAGLEGAIDAGRVAREAALHSLFVLLPPFGDVVALSRDEEMAVAVAGELAEREVAPAAEPREGATQGRALFRLSEVMHAGAEGVPFEREAVSPSPRQIMLLEHPHALAGAGERERSGEPSDPAADHDRVAVHRALSCTRRAGARERRVARAFGRGCRERRVRYDGP